MPKRRKSAQQVSSNTGPSLSKRDAFPGYSERDGVFFRDSPEAAEFSYSDGDEAENYLKQLIENSRDRSIFSRELIGGIRDWPSLYHLSPKRASLLRPFSEMLRGDILEVGAGCGAVTRFLGENGGSVVALEGSARRAKIAQLRTADLPNVRVVCERAEKFSPGRKFDVITLIGVLEYARVYLDKGEDAQVALLSQLGKLLKPDGIVIVAIENRLGLKYLAGAKEDHTGLPFSGVNDNYTGNSVATFGRNELSDIFDFAGLEHRRWYVPCPDYKLPITVLSPEVLSGHQELSATLLAQSAKIDPQQPAEPLFSLEQYWSVVYRNGLIDQLANSFLVVAGRNEASLRSLEQDKSLAWHYSVDRHPAFVKQTRFVASRNDVAVSRTTLKDEPAPAVPLRCVTEPEKLLKGRNWWLELVAVVNRPGWTVSQLSDWTRVWVQALLDTCKIGELNSTTFQTLVDGRFFDAAPFNMARDNQGHARFFDQEWQLTPPIEFGYVIFRGLKDSLLRVTSYAPPAPDVPLNVNQLILSVLSGLGVLVTKIELDRYALMEFQVQAWVQGRYDRSSPDDAISLSWASSLPIRTPVERESRLRESVEWSARLASATEQIETARVTATAQSERVASLLSELESVKVRIGEYEKLAGDRLTWIERGERRYADLEQETSALLSELSSERNGLLDHLSQLRDQFEELKTEARAREQNALVLGAEVDQARRLIVSLTDDLENSRTWLREAQAQSQSMAGDLDAAVRELDKEKSERRAVLSEAVRLRLSVQNSQKAQDEIRAEYERLRSELDTERAASETQRKREKDKGQQFAKALEEVRALALAEIESVRDEYLREKAQAEGKERQVGAELRRLKLEAQSLRDRMARQTRESEQAKSGRSLLRRLGRSLSRLRKRLGSRWSREAAAIEKSMLFDSAWHRDRYPDVAASGMDPLSHYLIYGGLELRDPNLLFDSAWYVEKNPQAATGDLTPLGHYVVIGVGEGADPTPLFDTDFYLHKNPDVAAGDLNPLFHYIRHGGLEGRDPHPAFSSSWYLEKNPDVAADNANPLIHYIVHGWKEGRDPHPLFDTSWYLENHPDVLSSGLDPLQHYLRFGMAEGLSTHPEFDASYYLAQNPDVAASGMVPFVHYWEFGIREGRKPNAGKSTTQSFEDVLDSRIRNLRGERDALPWSEDVQAEALPWSEAFNAPVPITEPGEPNYITRLMEFIYAGRPDLHKDYTLSTRSGREKFIDWFASCGILEHYVGGQAFSPELFEFLSQPALPGEPVITRLMHSIWKARPDLHRAFDLEMPQGRETFRNWFLSAGLKEYGLSTVPQETTSSQVRPSRPDGYGKSGANLIGYAKGEFGMGEHVRMTAHAMSETNVPFSIVNVDPSPIHGLNDRSTDHWLSEESIYRANIFHINADVMPLFMLQNREFLRKDKFQIGYWAWELPHSPPAWDLSIDLVDEIWAPSRYIERAFRERTKTPVVYMPLCATVTQPSRAYDKDHFGLDPHKYCFLYSFDAASWLERKNPLGTIQAFREAFPSRQEPVQLVIKTMNADQRDPYFIRLLEAIGEDERIKLIASRLSKDELLGLTSACDAYVSLHRSEGFGRGPIENMLFGKPVIVTNYSGVKDYANQYTACLVDYQMIPVREGEYPYWQGQEWADPDIDHAAWYMRELVERPSFGAELGKAAKAYVEDNFNPQVIGTRYRQRLEQIGAIDDGKSWSGADLDARPGAATVLVHVDRPETPGDRPIAVNGFVIFEGWAVAQAGIREVQLESSGGVLAKAHIGGLRPDIGALHPNWPDSGRSGYFVRWDSRDLPDGVHELDIVAVDKDGNRKSFGLRAQIDNSQTEYERWRGRHRLPAESFGNHSISSLSFAEKISFVLMLNKREIHEDSVRATIESLQGQVLDKWELLIGIPKGSALSTEFTDFLAARDLPISIYDGATEETLSLRELCARCAGMFICFLSPGDILDKHAILAFAATLSADPGADVIYSDHEVIGADGHLKGFRKPDWSPLLIEGENYLGRLWIARLPLVRKAVRSLDGSEVDPDHKLLINIAKMTKAVSHIPAVLCTRQEIGARPQRSGDTR